MTTAEKENKAMVMLTMTGYLANLIFGLTGYMSLMITEVLWAFYKRRDYLHSRRQT